jgi:hypothetical protein
VSKVVLTYIGALVGFLRKTVSSLHGFRQDKNLKYCKICISTQQIEFSCIWTDAGLIFGCKCILNNITFEQTIIALAQGQIMTINVFCICLSPCRKSTTTEKRFLLYSMHFIIYTTILTLDATRQVKTLR